MRTQKRLQTGMNETSGASFAALPMVNSVFRSVRAVVISPRCLFQISPLAMLQTSGELARLMRGKALGFVWRDSRKMADSSKSPVKDALKVILTEEDIPGATRS